MEYVTMVVAMIACAAVTGVTVWHFGAWQYEAGWVDCMDAHEEWDEAME